MAKINAKGEFLDITKNCKVIAADIVFDGDIFKLKPLYSDSEYNELLNFLDEEYNNGYGSQILHGTIYCENGIWIDRAEYDGSEWYEIHKYPDLRFSFNEVDVIKYERYKKLEKLSKSD